MSYTGGKDKYAIQFKMASAKDPGTWCVVGYLSRQGSFQEIQNRLSTMLVGMLLSWSYSKTVVIPENGA
jgi:hypothetical protein